MRSTIAAFVVLVLLCAGTTVGQTLPEHSQLGYGDHDIDIIVNHNENVAYVMPLKMGDKIIVDLAVESGGEVDFYLMNNYTMYLTSLDSQDASKNNLEMCVIGGGTYSRTHSVWISYEYTTNYDDTLVLLIDNSYLTDEGAVPEGEVVITGSVEVVKSIWTMENIIITIVIVILIIVIFVGFKLPKKEKPVIAGPRQRPPIPRKNK
ncbi:MAG: hypothetical protein KAS67_05560 [Thermoplasmata archaeon]|nr:hypothetical protein [Thermoplasmata archaeon]